MTSPFAPPPDDPLFPPDPDEANPFDGWWLPPAPTNVYADFREFFTEALSVWFERGNPVPGGVQWCPRWWLHPEAAARVTALWLAWEACNRDGGTAPAAWWVNYADPIMRELFEPQAAFAGCSPARSHRPANLPLPEDTEE